MMRLVAGAVRTVSTMNTVVRRRRRVMVSLIAWTLSALERLLAVSSFAVTGPPKIIVGKSNR